ncbi:histidine phosphatase family protein [Pseudomonas sp. v388]|uniref:lipopolysaccharide core heptose(II)-phosphate phosphatase PmrG n=1 Tax=Pseudomonas sp. v388 TaxID=2479849 RepID=UPI0021149C6D|nr:histidine phosphatase family protein [Pseudomonas sp. v388]
MAKAWIQDLRPVGRLPAFKQLHLVLAVVLVALVAVVGWFLTATHVVDLSVHNNLVKSGLHDSWLQGDVVVMVRHAERCDRSRNLCLDSADGITVEGSKAALAVGAGLRDMGLEHATLIASPLTRTRQTADFIAGHTVVTEQWVSECNQDFKDAVVAHKSRGENLVLITHSGCIDHFARQMGVAAGERSSAYTEAFFITIGDSGKPRLLGSLVAGRWNALSGEQIN